MAPLELTDAALERVEAVADSAVALAALSELPADQRAAVQARVVEERAYAEIARAARTSESVIRKRVSRGLAGMRAKLEERP
jgi:RNA polymerase sigma-70 factor (ECF subfamily)